MATSSPNSSFGSHSVATARSRQSPSSGPIASPLRQDGPESESKYQNAKADNAAPGEGQTDNSQLRQRPSSLGEVRRWVIANVVFILLNRVRVLDMLNDRPGMKDCLELACEYARKAGDEKLLRLISEFAAGRGIQGLTGSQEVPSPADVHQESKAPPDPAEETNKDKLNTEHDPTRFAASEHNPPYFPLPMPLRTGEMNLNGLTLGVLRTAEIAAERTSEMTRFLNSLKRRSGTGKKFVQLKDVPRGKCRWSKKIVLDTSSKPQHSSPDMAIRKTEAEIQEYQEQTTKLKSWLRRDDAQGSDTAPPKPRSSSVDEIVTTISLPTRRSSIGLTKSAMTQDVDDPTPLSTETPALSKLEKIKDANPPSHTSPSSSVTDVALRRLSLTSTTRPTTLKLQTSTISSPDTTTAGSVSSHTLSLGDHTVPIHHSPLRETFVPDSQFTYTSRRRSLGNSVVPSTAPSTLDNISHATIAVTSAMGTHPKESTDMTADKVTTETFQHRTNPTLTNTLDPTSLNRTDLDPTAPDPNEILSDLSDSETQKIARNASEAVKSNVRISREMTLRRDR